jgi:hypothetical protein
MKIRNDDIEENLNGTFREWNKLFWFGIKDYSTCLIVIFSNTPKCKEL